MPITLRSEGSIHCLTLVLEARILRGLGNTCSIQTFGLQDFQYHNFSRIPQAKFWELDRRKQEDMHFYSFFSFWEAAGNEKPDSLSRCLIDIAIESAGMQTWAAGLTVRLDLSCTSDLNQLYPSMMSTRLAIWNSPTPPFFSEKKKCFNRDSVLGDKDSDEKICKHPWNSVNILLFPMLKIEDGWFEKKSEGFFTKLNWKDLAHSCWYLSKLSTYLLILNILIKSLVT